MLPDYHYRFGGMRCRVCLVREGDAEKVISLHNPENVYELVRDELVSADREIMLSVLVTNMKQLIGVEILTIGSLNTNFMFPREVFKGAILANAAAIILCHNHPSGNLHPSSEDMKLTRDLIQAGKLMGIQILDHLIVTSRGYTSMRDHMSFNAE